MTEAERSIFRRKNIGIIYQDDNLIPFLTALENVELPLRMAGAKGATAKAKELLAEMRLEGRMAHRAAFLSGGERQRVAIATALVNSPRLLLADELTGELDSATAAAVMDSLERICAALTATVVIVTHSREVAARAARRALLVDGAFEKAEAREALYA